MPLKRCLRVYISYIRMAKLYTSDAGVTWPSLSTCQIGNADQSLTGMQRNEFTT